MNRIRGGRRKRTQVRVGAPDLALTPKAGLAAITELYDRLGVVEALNAAVGPVKPACPDLIGDLHQDGEWRAPEPDTREEIPMLSIRGSKDTRSAGLRASAMARE